MEVKKKMYNRQRHALLKKMGKLGKKPTTKTKFQKMKVLRNKYNALIDKANKRKVKK